MDTFKGAQDVIRCDVCSDNEREKSPAEVRCNTCDTNVCSPCVARHMSFDKLKKHDLVLFDFEDTKIILPSCFFHPLTKMRLVLQEMFGYDLSELFCLKSQQPHDWSTNRVVSKTLWGHSKRNEGTATAHHTSFWKNVMWGGWKSKEIEWSVRQIGVIYWGAWQSSS